MVPGKRGLVRSLGSVFMRHRRTVVVEIFVVSNKLADDILRDVPANGVTKAGGESEHH